MDKQYDHTSNEALISQKWEDADAFAPDLRKTTKNTETFTIMMPPPNANDPLHIGHAMFVALEDILIRFNRMNGKLTLWLPGTDHAGIETQFVYEKKLKKQGKSRFDFDRDTLYQNIWDYVQENSDIAVNQIKKLGASCDWSRFMFMLDPDNVSICLDTFEELNQKGLIYRDLQLVNYCTHCGTAFSSLEVLHETRTTPFFTMKYGEFEIGTVRPETKFRDTALAVNPKDKRYKHHIGKTFEILGLLGPVSMTVIADEGVDPEFGTGIMKVTPAHDPHDFELGKEHDLPVTPIIDFNGRMDFSWYLDNPENTDEKYRARAEKYHGTKVVNMRQMMKEDLEEDGLLVKYDENYTHSIGVCYRCKNPIEPLPLPQFFIKVKSLTQPILKKLANKEFTVHGAGHDKILKHWLENLKDWNISRQIVWGIRMPVWYDVKDNPDLICTFLSDSGQTITETIATLLKDHSLADISRGLQQLKAPIGATYEVSRSQPSKNHIQESDTFDTWFSSAQWPYSTLMALDAKSPNSPSNFEAFYPTSVMETGYDILPFWVMRMLMMGYFKTGTLPFSDIYLHGLVRDAKGQKMSKSKGNVLNPLDIIDQFGADALRFALVVRSSAGLDKSIGDGDFKAARNFTNKIWNASRYVLEFLKDDSNSDGNYDYSKEFDQKLSQVVADITSQMNDFKLGLAADTVYNEFWHWYCDICIEKNKENQLSHPDLIRGLVTFLKLLHPFVPFVTETLWNEITTRYPEYASEELIAISNWPRP